MGDPPDAGGATEPTPGSSAPATPRALDWPRIAAIAGLVALGVLLFRPVLLPLGVAVLIAYLLAPAVELVEGAGRPGPRVPRWLAVLTVYALVLAALGGTAATLLPRFWTDARALATRVPSMAETLRTEWIPSVERTLGLPPPARPLDPSPPAGPAPPPPSEVPLLRVAPDPAGGFTVLVPADGLRVEEEAPGRYRLRAAPEPRWRQGGLADVVTHLLDRVADFLDRESLAVLGRVRQAVTATASLILVGFFVLVGSAYLLATAREATAFAASLVPPARRPGLGVLVAEIDRGLSGVVRGQVLIALVNGALSGAGFVLLGLEHWVMLTAITTVASIVPVFGSLIASVPAVLIGLDQGIGTAALVVVWLLGIHQLEASVLNPRIMGDAARLSPVLVLFALLAGERTLGPPGLLLAVPILSVVSTVLLHVRDRAYPNDAEPAPTPRP